MRMSPVMIMGTDRNLFDEGNPCRDNWPAYSRLFESDRASCTMRRLHAGSVVQLSCTQSTDALRPA